MTLGLQHEDSRDAETSFSSLSLLPSVCSDYSFQQRIMDVVGPLKGYSSRYLK